MLSKYFLPMAALSVLGLTNIVTAASRNADNDDQRTTMSERQRSDGRSDRHRAETCDPNAPNYQAYDCCPPEPPVACYPDDCVTCPRCLGPENYAANPPVCPGTCGGDWIFTIAGFYWNSHQDGMEFAIENEVVNPDVGDLSVFPNDPDIGKLNNLVDARYKNPHFKWDFGFKLGFAYCSPCDGWDIGVVWTRYNGKASSNVDSDSEDNTTLLPLWSAFTPAQGNVLYATQAKSNWNLKLNLVDIELGRHFWTSKYLSIRPFIGIRFASLDQDYDITYRGGSWAARTADPLQEAYNGKVDLDNDFRGWGVRGGLNSEWNFGCGWALYGNLAASIVYGRFKVDHDETIRQAGGHHGSIRVLDTEESFHASRGILDLGLGIQWSTLFCDCQYGFTAMFGWEGHLFFNQNQMWRVARVNAVPVTVSTDTPSLPNNSGANVFDQRRGDLDTQGWTLTFKFEF